MLDLARLGRETPLGRAARWPLRLVPHGLVVPVLQGPLRGAKWVVGASTHGCWLGTYESELQAVFAREARRARVVYDAGANVGFYTLLAARSVPVGGHVCAFEPVPRNVRYLERHVQLNALRNVVVWPVALADIGGEERFASEGSAHEGRLDSGGPETVRVAVIDEITAAGRAPDPDLIKIDVEGAELRLLSGSRHTIERARPTILLSTHGERLHGECSRLLVGLGYRIAALSPADFLATGS